MEEKQDLGSGGLGQALPPKIHNEEFTLSSPQLPKVEHPTRIPNMDTLYSHLFQEFPLRLFPTPECWDWLELPQKSPKKSQKSGLKGSAHPLPCLRQDFP